MLFRYTNETIKFLSEATGLEEETSSESVEDKSANFNNAEMDEDIDDDDDAEMDFELQKKLMKSRKLYHKNKIQDVIKEGQTVLIQVVKEERGN